MSVWLSVGQLWSHRCLEWEGLGVCRGRNDGVVRSYVTFVLWNWSARLPSHSVTGDWAHAGDHVKTVVQNYKAQCLERKRAVSVFRNLGEVEPEHCIHPLRHNNNAHEENPQDNLFKRMKDRFPKKFCVNNTISSDRGAQLCQMSVDLFQSVRPESKLTLRNRYKTTKCYPGRSWHSAGYCRRWNRCIRQNKYKCNPWVQTYISQFFSEQSDELGIPLHKEIAVHRKVENVDSRKRIVEVTASKGEAGVVDVGEIIVGISTRGVGEDISQDPVEGSLTFFQGELSSSQHC